MRLPGKASIPRLEAALASQLHGSPLLEWAEHITLEVTRKAGQSKPPIEMNKRLLNSRRITSVEYVDVLPERARLEVRRDAFAVQMDARFSRNLPWRRFLLSHELAHTLFYEIDSEPIASRVFLRPGNAELEWLCSYLAKCLLMPIDALRETWLSEFLDKTKADISVLFGLSERFGLPWSVVAERLVEDTGLWNVILLHWQQEPSPSQNWRLVWHVSPAHVPPGLFIPIGRRQPSGEMHYPRAKGQLAKMLDQLASSEESGQRVLSVAELTVGNLHKMMSEGRDNRDAVDWVLVGRDDNGRFEWAQRPVGASILIRVKLDESTSRSAQGATVYGQLPPTEVP